MRPRATSSGPHGWRRSRPPSAPTSGFPLCHTLPLNGVDVDIDVDPVAGTVIVTVTTRVYARTGVEMEAMVGCAAGALTIYDMVKGIERGVVVEKVELLSKSGGRSGTWRRDEQD